MEHLHEMPKSNIEVQILCTLWRTYAYVLVLKPQSRCKVLRARYYYVSHLAYIAVLLLFIANV
jgi:hypothetical protein